MDEARILLSRIPPLYHPSDLDLLVFFAKHPRTLMASEQLARLLGYKITDIAQSVDVLLGAGFLTRAENGSRSAQMYVVVTDGTSRGWLSDFLELASTRDGRLALRLALTASREGGDCVTAPDEDKSTAVVRRHEPPSDEQRKVK
jgi:hypothetical protein